MNADDLAASWREGHDHTRVVEPDIIRREPPTPVEDETEPTPFDR